VKEYIPLEDNKQHEFYQKESIDSNTNKKILYQQIKEREKSLDLIKKMQSWTEILRVFGVKEYAPEYNIFLLEIDISQERLTVTAFNKNQEDKAIETLERLEKKNQDRKEYDIVLVGADKIEDVKKAYSNYFADTKDFLKILEKILGKASDK
jgi:hypothetical protein